MDHSFQFDAPTDSPGVRILDFRYGDGTGFGTSNPQGYVEAGKPLQRIAVFGQMRRPDALYVKWQVLETDEIYEDTVDLRNRLPHDFDGAIFYFMVRGRQLEVYLIERKPRLPNTPSEGPEKYRNLKVSKLYAGAAEQTKLVPRIYSADRLVLGDHDGNKADWISENEVVFLGYRVVPDTSVPDTGVRVDSELDVWDLRTGDVRTLKEFGRAHVGFCVNGDRLHAGAKAWGKDGKRTSYYGNAHRLEVVAPGRWIHRSMCEWEEKVPKLPEWTKSRAISYLEKPDGGFVDLGEAPKFLENTPIRMYRHGASIDQGITLPLLRRETSHRFPWYEFANAYFVESTYWQLPRPPSVPYPVYWLHPDGRVERIAEVPWGPWRNGTTWTVPTRKGVVLISQKFNVRNARDLGHAGMYLIRDGKMTKLLSAWIRTTAVSPSGCRVVFDYADRATDLENTLRVIDLCVDQP